MLTGLLVSLGLAMSLRISCMLLILHCILSGPIRLLSVLFCFVTIWATALKAEYSNIQSHEL